MYHNKRLMKSFILIINSGPAYICMYSKYLEIDNVCMYIVMDFSIPAPPPHPPTISTSQRPGLK